MTTAGLASAAVGAIATAPVGGEGGAPGLAVAGLGEIVSLVGAGVEFATNAIAGDYSKAAEGGATYAAGELAGKLVDAAVPGNNPSVAPIFQEVIKVGQKTTKVIASDKAKELIKKVND